VVVEYSVDIEEQCVGKLSDTPTLGPEHDTVVIKLSSYDTDIIKLTTKPEVGQVG
jgi:hypothetical protein